MSVISSIPKYECAICREEEEQESSDPQRFVVATGDQHPYLGHIFHSVCINDWFTTSNSRDCPSCRSQVAWCTPARPFITAVHEDKLPEVRRILAEKTEQAFLIDFIAQTAARQGKEAIVSAILETQPQLRNKVAFAALGAGQIKLAENLLKDHAISDDYLEAIFEDAAHQGYLNIVKMLLDRKSISVPKVEQALLNASKDGRLEIVQAILASQEISQEILWRAVASAFENRQKEIVGMLLATASISESALRQNFLEAAKQGYLDMVELFLPYAQEFSTEAFSVAVQEVAAKQGYLDFSRAFSADIKEFSTEALSVAVQKQQGREEVVRFLFENGPISESAFEQALFTAARRNLDNIANILLIDREISKTLHEALMNTAIKEGCVSIVNLLLDRALLSEGALDKALRICFEKGYHDLSQVLLDRHKIQMNEWEFESLALRGETSRLEIRLTQIQFSEDCIRRALFNAARNGRADTIELLLRYPISKLACKQVLAIACRMNRPEVIRMLLSRHSFSFDDYLRAMKIAYRSGSLENCSLIARCFVAKQSFAIAGIAVASLVICAYLKFGEEI